MARTLAMEGASDTLEMPHGQWPELLADMADAICRKFIALGKPDGVAKNEALLAIEAITEEWQGCMVYIPMAKGAAVAMKHHRLYLEYDGTNVRELAIKHKYSIQQVYRVIKRQAQLQRQDRGAK